MKIEKLFDRGSAKVSEDCHLVRPPFCVVADGVSPPYNSANPLLMVQGRSAGAVVAALVCDTFASATAVDSAHAVMARANAQVGALQQGWGRVLDRPDLLAGASVVAAKLADTVEIVQVGDALACWRNRGGQTSATVNTVYGHEQHLLVIVARIMEEVRGDRAAMWERYYPLRCTAVRAHTNCSGQLGFSVVNGQPEAVSLFQVHQIPTSELETLLIFSDGLVPVEQTRDPQELARFVFAAYDKGGLAYVLEETRAIESPKEGRSHVSRAEATAIAISL